MTAAPGEQGQKRICVVCGSDYEPALRKGDRQRTCAGTACQSSLQREINRRYRKRHLSRVRRMARESYARCFERDGGTSKKKRAADRRRRAMQTNEQRERKLESDRRGRRRRLANESPMARRKRLRKKRLQDRLWLLKRPGYRRMYWRTHPNARLRETIRNLGLTTFVKEHPEWRHAIAQYRAAMAVTTRRRPHEASSWQRGELRLDEISLTT